MKICPWIFKPSGTTPRTLAEFRSRFVLHDFDASGLTILRTLRADTRRYSFDLSSRGRATSRK
jgi:hypothetical protein